MTVHPDLADVEAARGRISGEIRLTPLLPAPDLGAGVLLKDETAQETGSFKVRGAANTLLLLTAEERAAGVVAVSSGNHGRAVAHMARRLGISATICVSERVPPNKVEAMQALGASVLVAGPGQDEAEALARRLVAEQGLTFVHPFDDPRVISGQGTLGLEVVDMVADLAQIVVPLSGGGLISGVAVAVKSLAPGVRVVGVSQDRGPAMYESVRAGVVTPVVEEDTLADALAGGLGEQNLHTLAMVTELVDEILLVSEDEMAEAMRHLHARHRLRVEGGGAVGVAALLSGRVPVQPTTVVVVSGGNVGDPVFDAVVAGTSDGS